MRHGTMSDRALHERLLASGYRRADGGGDGPPAYERDADDGPLRVRRCKWDDGGEDWYEVSGWTKDANHDMVTAGIWDVRSEDLIARLEHYEGRVRRMLRLALDTAEPRQRG